MNSGLNILLRLALSQGLANREMFVEKLGVFLQQKMGQDEADAEKYGKNIMQLLENLNDELLFESVAGNNRRTDPDLSAKLDDLTKAIKELSTKIEATNR
jgi:hypothetical protein